jgi:NAD(P)-dependent dehydrogenase (short-subunit alcohol dehydrogenase family)
MQLGLLDGSAGFVTGAASGLGRATALLAAREGARVVVADIRDDDGRRVALEVSEAGGEARYVHADVARAEDVEALVAASVDAYGSLDWAVNNAVGGTGRFCLLHEIDAETWQKSIDVCLKGTFHGLKYAIPAMLRTGGGSIVNVTTAALRKGEAMLGAYVAAKGGVDALTRTAAAEYAARGVRVNSVAPGGFTTPQLERYFRRFPEHRERTVATHAMRRLGTPEEVAEAVVWLASPRASFVTGACLVVDGGSLVNSHLL